VWYVQKSDDIICYIIGVASIIIAHKGDPTNIAGPGLDMLVYTIVFIVSAVFVIITLGRALDKKLTWGIFVCHLIGFASLIALLFMA